MIHVNRVEAREHGIISAIPGRYAPEWLREIERTTIAVHFTPQQQGHQSGSSAVADSFSQTPKGTAEFAAKPGKLTPGLKTLLGMVGLKVTIEDLKTKLPQVPTDKLTAALNKLVADGYLQRVAAPERVHAESSLDFTRFINRPVKEPTLNQKRQAEATIASIRTTKRAGFQANILNRASKRIEPHAGGDKHTILVVDADDANALIVTRALLLAKFDTRAASKRDEILAQLNMQPAPDAIAMDINLPEVGGRERLPRQAVQAGGSGREHPGGSQTLSISP